MRWLIYIFLTTSLSAQSIDILFERLQSPIEFERAVSIQTLIDTEEDISKHLQRQWKNATFAKQTILIHVAKFRSDPCLLEFLEGWTVQIDRREHLKSYLLSLSSSDLPYHDASTWLSKLLKYRIVHKVITAAFDDKMIEWFSRIHFDALLKEPLIFDMCFNILEHKQYVLEAIEDVYHRHPISKTEATNLKSITDAWNALEDTQTDQPDHLYRGFRIIQYIKSGAARILEANADPKHMPVVKQIYDDTVKNKIENPHPNSKDFYNLLEKELEFTIASMGDKSLIEDRLKNEMDTIGVSVIALPRAFIFSSAPVMLSISASYLRLSEYEAAIKWADAVIKNITDNNQTRYFRQSLGRAVVYKASAKSLMLKTSDAMETLKNSIGLEAMSWEWVAGHPDLYSTRQTTEFEEWFFEHAPPSTYDKWKADGSR